MKKKTTYRIRNWGEYNKALKQRGSLTVWVSEEALQHWLTEEKTGAPGASPQFTELAIETMATVQAVYHLAGRQTQGFLQSLFGLMKLDLAVPDHSTLSRRRGGLRVELPVRESSQARHLVIDSTGVKVFGEGEWKVRQHGVSKRRTWRKLHLCVDGNRGGLRQYERCQRRGDVAAFIGWNDGSRGRASECGWRLRSTAMLRCDQ